MSLQPPKNIFIIGGPSTGKTTLVDSLRDYYRQNEDSRCSVSSPRVISEVARTAMRRLNIYREDIAASPELSFRLQMAIIQAQREAEAECEVWYISDRSGLDPIVYTHLFVGPEGVKQLLASAAWKALEQNMREGLVFLCESGREWLVDDGTRLMPQNSEEWSAFDHAFRQLLEARDIKYTVISKDKTDIAERVKLVVKAEE